MNVRVAKDPDKRRGGWALIRLPEGISGQTHLQLRRDEGALTLGPHGWQGSAHAFGPYPIETDAGGPRLRIGPEIVNQMEAYLTVDLILPDLELRETLTWPETVVPALDAFEGGGVAIPDAGGNGLRDSSAGSPAAPRGMAALERTSAVAPPQTASDRPDEVDVPLDRGDRTFESEPVGNESTSGSTGRLRKYWLLPVVLVLFGAVGAATWWWLSLADPVARVPDEPAPSPEAEAVACEAEALRPVLQDETSTAERLWSLVDRCRRAGERDLEVQLVGRLEEMNDPRAIHQFGRWYDPLADTEASPFQSDASNAVIYYKRASAAGAPGAAEDLEALCAMLRGNRDPISETIIEIHCNN